MRFPAGCARLLCAATVVAATSVPTLSAHAESLRDLLPFGRTHRIEGMLKTVVNTYTHKVVTDPDGSKHLVPFYGSGFIIDPSGLIVTNEHVVAGTTDITVVLSDGTALPAKLIGTGNGAIDIALLKVDPPHPLPAARWGNSDNVRVGDEVLAVGNPLGVGESVSSGIVSAKNRDILDSPFDDYIQTDAAINHGNSGGPLFDASGYVIGVDTALETPSQQGGSVGVGFSIPGNDARAAIAQLRQYGRLRLGWLGVKAQDVTPNIADALASPVPYGAIVVSVDKDGPAARAGLKVGDIVLQYGRERPRDARALARLIAATPIGEPASLRVWRDGKEQTLGATVAEWPLEAGSTGTQAASARPAHIDSPTLGLQTADVTEALRTKYKLPAGEKGVVITGVDPGTSADESGLVAGQVIERVQDAKVSAPADVVAAISAARTAGRRHVLLLVHQPDGTLRWFPLVVDAPAKSG